LEEDPIRRETEISDAVEAFHFAPVREVWARRTRESRET
jgi:hypothetical protein